MTCRFRDEIEYEPVTFSGEIQKNSGLLFHLYDLAILSLYCFGSLDFAPGSAVSLLAGRLLFPPGRTLFSVLDLVFRAAAPALEPTDILL